MLNRESVRQQYEALGISNESLSRIDIECLIETLARTLADHKSFMKIDRRRRRPRYGLHDIRCRSHYFDNRELVTFYPTGDELSVGFAGWASDDNVAPILIAFVAWMSEVATSRGLSAPTLPSRLAESIGGGE